MHSSSGADGNEADGEEILLPGAGADVGAASASSGGQGQLAEREIDLGIDIDPDATGWALCAGYLMIFFFMSHWTQLAVFMLSGGTVAKMMARRQITLKQLLKVRSCGWG